MSKTMRIARAASIGAAVLVTAISFGDFGSGTVSLETLPALILQAVLAGSVMFAGVWAIRGFFMFLGWLAVLPELIREFRVRYAMSRIEIERVALQRLDARSSQF